jgi:Subtilase family
MAAAWNARAAAKPGQAPTVVIGDDFGNGKPPNLFSRKKYLDAMIVGGKLTNPPDGSGNDHGYHVSGIVFGNLANDRTAPGLVTGAFPKRGKLVPIDRYEDNTLLGDPAQFAPAIDAIPGRVVVNTSIGFRECVSTIAGADAVKWIEAVRDLGLEDRVFHTASAGNEGKEGGSALCGSRWSAAATRTDLQDTGGNPVDPLTNTLAVENVSEEANSSALTCLSETSNIDGSIAAPGREVWSFTKTGGAKNKNGTSMASPLVGGLATYLWSIDKDLTPQQLGAAIRMNADDPLPVKVCERESAKRLDAYAATLSLDQTGAPAPATWPVRFAILNKNGDEKFDQKDLAAFRPEVKPSLLNTKRDWSRFDLNGDGYTGGLDSAPFDLDRTGSTRAGTTVLGDPVTDGNGAEYDENSVTDADVLCFYAHSPLYTGSPTRRAEELEGLCEPPGSVEFEGGSAQVVAFCSVSGEGEVKFADQWGIQDFSFSETASGPPCASATQNSTIVVNPNGATIGGSGSASRLGPDAADGESVVDTIFTVSGTLAWEISGTVASDGHGAQATIELDDPDGHLRAGNCSFGGVSDNCAGGPPDSSFSDSGTLPPGVYHLDAFAICDPNVNGGSCDASWDVTLELG